jgi:thiosulfate/3-mercaptopyruvate sulfurtransferase
MKSLVTVDWLAQHLDDETVRVVDIRGRVLPPSEPLPHYYAHREAYEAAHIPGAVFVDWTTDIVEPGSPSQDILNAEDFGRLMGRLGIGAGTQVVAYDDADGMFAARLWWALRYYGHESVAVLDGGWKLWTARGLPTTAEVVQPHEASFIPRVNAGLRQTSATVSQRTADTALVDVRSPAEFRGEVSRARRRGHIPGAVNVPRTALVNPDGTLKAPDELRQLFVDAGVRLESPAVIAYCNAGVSASYGLLALEAAGFRQASIYDGSWKDWGNDENLPVEPAGSA